MSDVKWHKFVYEVWPTDDLPSWPRPVPAHKVLYVRDGEGANLIVPDVEPDEMTYRVAHVRSQCRPQCPTESRKGSRQ